MRLQKKDFSSFQEMHSIVILPWQDLATFVTRPCHTKRRFFQMYPTLVIRVMVGRHNRRYIYTHTHTHTHTHTQTHTQHILYTYIYIWGGGGKEIAERRTRGRGDDLVDCVLRPHRQRGHLETAPHLLSLAKDVMFPVPMLTEVYGKVHTNISYILTLHSEAYLSTR